MRSSIDLTEASEKLEYNVYPELPPPPSAPPAYEANASNAKMQEPSAPPPPPAENELILSRFSHDQVVNWWNGFEEKQRDDLLREAQKLSPQALGQLRSLYSKYYPHEYYPHNVYEPGQLSSSDCCILFHCSDDLQRKNLSWYTAELAQSTQLRPPAYEAVVAPPPTYEEATKAAKRWFDALSAEQQQAARIEARRLRPQQVIFIRQRLLRCYPGYASIYTTRPYYIDDFDLFLMASYQAQFNSFIWFTAMRATFEVGALALRGGWFLGNLAFHGLRGAVSGIGSLLGGVGSRASGGRGGDRTSAKDKALGFVIIAALIAAATAAVGGFVYSIKKLVSAISNLAKGEKLGRSLWRLSWITGGGASGGYGGALLGAMIGTTIFPGLGSVGGAVIGAIIGTGILAAVGAVIGKYTAQLYSYITTGTTNPDRYDSHKALRNMQQQGVVADLQNQGINLTTQVVKEVLNDTQKAKEKFKALKGHPQVAYRSNKKGTSENAEKQLYTKFADALVKEGKNPFEPIRVDANTVMMWNRTNHEIQKQNVEMPRPVGGLTI